MNSEIFKLAAKNVEEALDNAIEKMSTLSMKQLQDMEPEELQSLKDDYTAARSMCNYITEFNKLLIEISENQSEILKKIEKLESKAK